MEFAQCEGGGSSNPPLSLKPLRMFTVSLLSRVFGPFRLKAVGVFLGVRAQDPASPNPHSPHPTHRTQFSARTSAARVHRGRAPVLLRGFRV